MIYNKQTAIYWFIIGHNFWTRNVRKSIKVSKDVDSS